MSDGKIRALPPPPSSVPEPDVVAALERWLARARAGEIRGFVLAAAGHDDSVYTGIERGDADKHYLVSGVELVKHRLLDLIVERSHDMPPPTPNVDPPPEP